MEKNAINPSELHRISMNILLITFCCSLLLLRLQSIIHSIQAEMSLSKFHCSFQKKIQLLASQMIAPRLGRLMSFRITIHLLKSDCSHGDSASNLTNSSLTQLHDDDTKIGANLFTKLPLSTMHSLHSGDEPLSFLPLPWLWSGFYFLTTSQVRTLAFFGSNEFHTKLL